MCGHVLPGEPAARHGTEQAVAGQVTPDGIAADAARGAARGPQVVERAAGGAADAAACVDVQAALRVEERAGHAHGVPGRLKSRDRLVQVTGTAAEGPRQGLAALATAQRPGGLGLAEIGKAARECELPYATIALATLSGINPFIANVMGYAIGLAIGLSLNSRITFNKRKASLVRYLLAFAGAFALNLATVYVAIHAMGVPEVIGSLAGMPIYTIAFFLLCEHWVFRKVAA